jgi:hypothetical protein
MFIKMKKILFVVFILLPLLSMAQQPKMNIKIFGGTNMAKFVYRVEDVESDILTGWQVGGSLRVYKRKAFIETGLTFIDYGISVDFPELSDTELEETIINIQMRALELPVQIGYVPVKTPVFKWFLYGGLNNRFSLKGRYNVFGLEGTFKPKEADLHVYNLSGRFGTQFDIAIFNFDLNYNIGITNGYKNRVRTNTHIFQISAGILF